MIFTTMSDRIDALAKRRAHPTTAAPAFSSAYVAALTTPVAAKPTVFGIS